MVDKAVTENRKREHIETVLGSDVTAKGVTTGFERFFFEHVALPELSLDDVDLSCELFGKRLYAPPLISSVRSVAPDILLFANVGAVQLNYGYGADEVRRAVDMIEANAVFLHLNSLQEAVQVGGDRDWRGLLGKIEALIHEIEVPVVVKEVGNGISASLVRRLADMGVAAVDIAGAGGTSWCEVEAHRQSDPSARRIAHSFAGWGIPTALALMRRANWSPTCLFSRAAGCATVSIWPRRCVWGQVCAVWRPRS